jgi:hypothetical protein
MRPPAALYSPGRFLVLVSVRGWVDRRAIVWLDRSLGRLKNPITLPRIEPATFWPVARRFCHLQLLLALASAVFFGSDSRGTPDRILLSQIRDFPFCRLLRLAGLRWWYSTPPPHGTFSPGLLRPPFITSGEPHRNHRLQGFHCS